MQNSGTAWQAPVCDYTRIVNSYSEAASAELKTLQMKPVSMIISIVNPGTVTPKMESSTEKEGIRSHLYLG